MIFFRRLNWNIRMKCIFLCKVKLVVSWTLLNCDRKIVKSAKTKWNNKTKGTTRNILQCPAAWACHYFVGNIYWKSLKWTKTKLLDINIPSGSYSHRLRQIFIQFRLDFIVKILWYYVEYIGNKKSELKYYFLHLCQYVMTKKGKIVYSLCRKIKK